VSQSLVDINVDPALQAKLAVCADVLTRYSGVAVAASGGVDSTLVLALAVRTLGAENVLAVTARGPLYPPEEPLDAAEIAEQLGVRHLFVEADPLGVPGVGDNPPDRCYHCKTLVFGGIKEVAATHGLEAVVSGDNAEDPSDYRPGLQAVRELGVVAPLLEAGMAKVDIRAVSAALGLPTAQKPSAACLASRVPYGQTLTAERLGRIAQAERVLREMGFGQCRLRDHEPLARIEVTADDLPRAFELRTELVAALKPLGYTYVTLDLQGFRTGAMNETLGSDS